MSQEFWILNVISFKMRLKSFKTLTDKYDMRFKIKQ